MAPPTAAARRRESQTGVLKTGDVHWRENGVVHAVENISKTEEHALIVEIRDRK